MLLINILENVLEILQQFVISGEPCSLEIFENKTKLGISEYNEGGYYSSSRHKVEEYFI